MATTSRSIKPIETRYKGHRFRSRLEARWAVVFDAAGIEWRYEEQGFELTPRWENDENLGPYLPDFYLPLIDTYVEVKPVPPKNDTIEYKKLERLCYLSKARGVFCTSLEIESGMHSIDCNSRHPGDWPFDAAPLALHELPITHAIRNKKFSSFACVNHMQCPICGFEYVHPYEDKAENANYNRLAEIYARDYDGTDLKIIKSFYCENNHHFCLAVGFRKGFGSIAAIYNPVSVGEKGPAEYLIKPEHLNAGRAARFEHGERG